MTDDIEVRSNTTTDELSDGKGSVSSERPVGVGVVLGNGSKIGGRCLQEIGLQFGLRVLLTANGAVLGNDSTVIVGSVASRMAKVTPIGTTISHVNVEDGDTKAEIVLVEYTLELWTEESSTFGKTAATPRIEATTLKFYDRVSGRGALLTVEGEIVCWQGIVRPGVRVGAVEAQRITIMTIDIDCSGLTRSKVAVWGGVVADEGHNNTGVAKLLLNVAKVGRVGELDAWDRLGVFILRLDKNNRAAVGDLGFGDDLTNAPCVAERVSAGRGGIFLFTYLLVAFK